MVAASRNLEKFTREFLCHVNFLFTIYALWILNHVLNYIVVTNNYKKMALNNPGVSCRLTAQQCKRCNSKLCHDGHCWSPPFYTASLCNVTSSIFESGLTLGEATNRPLCRLNSWHYPIQISTSDHFDLGLLYNLASCSHSNALQTWFLANYSIQIFSLVMITFVEILS